MTISTPVPSMCITDQDRKEIFRLTDSGDIIANWHEMRRMYDQYIAGNREMHVVMAAAIWSAKNR